MVRQDLRVVYLFIYINAGRYVGTSGSGYWSKSGNAPGRFGTAGFVMKEWKSCLPRENIYDLVEKERPETRGALCMCSCRLQWLRFEDYGERGLMPWEVKQGKNMWVPLERTVCEALHSSGHLMF
ncbi:hypothetical protein CEXT_729381, partial [Caerostris extrusa]